MLARRAARAADAKETEPPLALALGTDGLSSVVALRASVALALHRGAAAAPPRHLAAAPSGLGSVIALRAAAPTGERRGSVWGGGARLQGLVSLYDRLLFIGVVVCAVVM